MNSHFKHSEKVKGIENTKMNMPSQVTIKLFLVTLQYNAICVQAFCGLILLPFSEKVFHMFSGVPYDADSKCAGKY